MGNVGHKHTFSAVINIPGKYYLKIHSRHHMPEWSDNINASLEYPKKSLVKSKFPFK